MIMEQDRWYKKGDALLDEIGASLPGPGMTLLWFLGQHGFIIALEDQVIYIDVILNDFIGRDGKSLRSYPPPFAPDIPQRVDYFLCTHNHGDHLNPDTLIPLAKANPQTKFVLPMPFRHILVNAGIGEDRVLGGREGEDLQLAGGITLSSVAAAHSEYLQDEKGDYLCLGYILRGRTTSIYHAGDTLVTPRLVDTLKARKPIDIAILPINGSDWERTSWNIIGNMNMEDAVKLARAIGTDLVIPAHYDMMAGNSENPALFAAYMYSLCPEKRYHIFALGEGFCYMKKAVPKP
jgi:L-ascorbate metabolism protein UlaG (beta-lactamase superfamily)